MTSAKKWRPQRKTEALDSDSLSEVGKCLSMELYHLLALTVKGTAQSILRNAPRGNGLEDWRRLSPHYEPALAGGFVGLMQEILNPKFDWQAYERSCLDWEETAAHFIGKVLRDQGRTHTGRLLRAVHPACLDDAPIRRVLLGHALVDAKRFQILLFLLPPSLGQLLIEVLRPEVCHQLIIVMLTLIVAVLPRPGPSA